ncbi:hypothetical protein AAFF_G00434230 [Aldrovandia affinis]|uniref:Uncharacterized protein n=1 Tax=Aldrovandia affinis TaxID=143900 RepID=A0AAD7S858_9TELE|nr:hypothetical protein AAFF_G00434230 [Aldrovandia affinis]
MLSVERREGAGFLGKSGELGRLAVFKLPHKRLVGIGTGELTSSLNARCMTSDPDRSPTRSSMPPDVHPCVANGINCNVEAEACALVDSEAEPGPGG